MSIAFLACFVAASNFYHLPPRVLPSIQIVEGGSVGSVSRNTDGSEDLGVMQINTLWIAPLATATRLTQADIRARLINDACFNIAAAAAILRTYLNEEHGDLMRAVGDFHSHTPARNAAYQSRVLGAAARLFAARPSPASSKSDQR
jgi:soluble lytic murein transglycosylase-like protein